MMGALSDHDDVVNHVVPCNNIIYYESWEPGTH